MDRLRISIVGLGLAVEPHARSLIDLAERIEVRFAASPSERRTAEFARWYPFATTNDVGRAIEDPDVDIVLLLTPPSTHLELGMRCLAAGKHLIVEKPLALTVAEGAALVDASVRSGRRLGVVLQHRFRQSSQRAASLISTGALGRIEGATVTVPWWRPQSYYDEPGRGTWARDGGGVLMTQAIHTLDLFRSLVGVEKVLAASVRTTSLHRMESEDLAMALVELSGGRPGTIVATTAAYPGRCERIDIIGELGSLAIEGEGLEFCTIGGLKEVIKSESGTGAGADPMRFDHAAHRALLADFLDAVVDGREPRVSGSEALATQLLIERILEVSRTREAADVLKAAPDA
jgi:predicted dehydrogenase